MSRPFNRHITSKNLEIAPKRFVFLFWDGKILSNHIEYSWNIIFYHKLSLKIHNLLKYSIEFLKPKLLWVTLNIYKLGGSNSSSYEERSQQSPISSGTTSSTSGTVTTNSSSALAAELEQQGHHPLRTKIPQLVAVSG